MQWIEVPKRSVFRHPVRVDKAGVLLVWNFSTLKKDIGFGVSMRLVADSDVKGFKEILPVKRYDAQKAAVKDQLKIDEPGTYVLVFDNSYSKLTSKRLTFWTDIKAVDDVSAEPDLAGWMLKKKKKQGLQKAWSKRWCQLNQGVLTYYERPGAYCRGTIDLASATIAVIMRTRQINIDNGVLLFHLKALTTEDLTKWIDVLKKYQAVSVSKQQEADNEDHHDDGTSDLDGKIAKIQADLDRVSQLLPSAMSSSSSLNIKGVKSDSSSASKGTIKGSLSVRKSNKTSTSPTTPSAPSPSIPDTPGAEDSSSTTHLLGEIVHDIRSSFADLVAEHNANKRLLAEEISRRRALEVEVRELRERGPVERTASPVLSPAVAKSLGSAAAFSPGHRRVGSRSSVAMSTTSSGQEDKFFDAAEILVDGSEACSDDDDEGQELIEADEDIDDDSDDESDLLQDASDHLDSEAPAHLLRRKFLPAPTPTSDINLFGILRKNVGKELSKVSMPVLLNEPLSILQRVCEELEYSELLDKAANLANPLERIQLVGAFAVSSYASTFLRPSKKPFNPLLGETYECVRPDKGFKFIAEKVQHHPVVMACHAESPNYVFYQEQQPKSKFWGKSMELSTEGVVHVVFPKTGDHYTWSKVTTCMRNIFSDSRYLEHYGDMVVSNKTTGDTCAISFKESSYFSSAKNEVVGIVKNNKGEEVTRFAGKWHESLQVEVDKDNFKLLWRAHPSIPNANEQYGFTQFAIELNELTEDIRGVIPPTDSRLRPDQRLLEEARIDEAEAEKVRVEEKQRQSRKQLEDAGKTWQPRWFEHKDGEFRYKGGYWEARDKGGFKSIPSIFF